MKLLTLTLLLAGIAAAQTSTVNYNMPAGITCIGSVTVNPVVLESCTFHNMQVAQPTDGSALPVWALPFAYFSGGGYWQQVDFQAYQGENPAQAAIYALGTGKWVSAAMDNGDTLFTFDATTGESSGMTGNFTIHAEIQAHTYKETYRCGGPRGSSNTCTRYDWAVDTGFVNVTQVQ